MARVTIVGAGNLGRGIGSLGRGQQLEQVGFLHISLQQPLGLGFGSTIKPVTP